MEDDARLLGQGVHFPPKINAEGRWAWSRGGENICQSIRILLQTEPLERVMLPEYGAGLKGLLFQPNVAATHRLIEESIAKALARWEPRIAVDSVDVREDPDDRRAALVMLRYSLVARRETDQFQFQVLLSS